MYFVVYTSRALLKFDGDFAPDLGTEDIPADIVSEKDFLVSDCHKSRPSHLLSLYVLYVRFDKWEIILQHNVRRGIILGQHFESGFRRFVSKKNIFFIFSSYMYPVLQFYTSYFTTNTLSSPSLTTHST